MAFGTLKGTLVGGATSVTNPLNATGSVSVSAGDLIVAVYAELTSDTLTGVTDNLGNTYTAQNAGSAATAAGRAFWSRATVSGTLTTVSAATTASADDAALVVGVFDQGPNGFAASPLDANPANTTGDVTSPFTCPLTGTLAQASELVIGWMALTRGQTNTAATAPFNLAANSASSTANAASSVCAALAYQAVAATTSVQANFTCASGTFNGSVVGTMSFKEAVALPFRQREWPNPEGSTAAIRHGAITNKEWSFQGNSLYLGQGAPAADTTHILRDPLYTRIERVDPGAAIRAGAENPPQPLTLNAAPAPATVLREATVYKWQGAQHPVALRTFTSLLNPNLIGQDVIYGAPGEVPGYTAAQPRDIAFPGGLEQVSVPKTLTEPPATPPFAQTNWPNPVLRVRAGQFEYSAPLTLVGGGQAPFSQSEWPVPTGAQPSVALKTQVPANLQTTPFTPPPATTVVPREATVYRWQGREFPVALRTFTNSLNPNLIGQDVIYGAPGEVPAYSWPQPRDIAFPDGIDPQGSALTTSSIIPPPPFAQTQWPNPGQPRRNGQYEYAEPLTLAGGGLKPFAQTDWQNPQQPRRNNPDQVSEDLTAMLPPPPPSTSSGLIIHGKIVTMGHLLGR